MRLLIAFLLSLPLWAQNNYAVDFNSAQSDKLYRAIANFRSGDQVGFVSVWFKTDQTTNAYSLVSSSDEGITGTHMLRLQVRPASASSLMVIVQRNNDTQDAVQGGNAFASGTYYHVMAGSDGSDYFLWFGVAGDGGNGTDETEAVLTGSNTGDWYADTGFRDNITIGLEQGLVTQQPFDGQIDEVSIHNVTPTQALWEAIHNNGVPRDVTTINGVGVVNYWRFEEGSGQYAFDSVGSDTLVFGDDETVETDDPAWVVSEFGWDAGVTVTRKPNLNKLNSLKGLKP